jgi:hypothetical protein
MIQSAFAQANSFIKAGFTPQSISGLNTAENFKDGPPLRVLALGMLSIAYEILVSYFYIIIDGGGIRGLSSLLILKEIMKNTPKKPCEVFDMIGGTSTGG